MWPRTRLWDTASEAPADPAHADGADGAELLPGPVRLDWTSAEVTGYRLFFPTSFTPTYAYPLVVFVHDEHCSDADLNRWFPQVSDQNFLAAAVRAPFPHPQGFPGRFSWHKQPLRQAGRVVATAVDSVTALWKVHPERIYLMGEGLGAELAWQLALGRSTYAGAIAIEPKALVPHGANSNPRLLKRMLLVESSAVAVTSPPAGLEVTNVTNRLEQAALARLINHWLMATIPGTVW